MLLKCSIATACISVRCEMCLLLLLILPVLCSKATHNSGHISWLSIVWTAVAVKLVKMTVSIMADIAPWTAFQRAYRTSTKAARFVTIVCLIADNLADSRKQNSKKAVCPSVETHGFPSGGRGEQATAVHSPTSSSAASRMAVVDLCPALQPALQV